MTDRDKNRKRYRDDVDAMTSEAGWTFWKAFNRVVLPFIAVCVLIGAIGYGLGWFGEAADVAREQFGPRASLQKYEWFKDQSSRIDKMDQDIALFEQRRAGVKTQFVSAYGEDRAKWPPTAQMQYASDRKQATDDLLAILSQRNNLVREYNAQSEKFNWKTYNTSDRPRSRYDEYRLEP